MLLLSSSADASLQLGPITAGSLPIMPPQQGAAGVHAQLAPHERSLPSGHLPLLQAYANRGGAFQHPSGWRLPPWVMGGVGEQRDGAMLHRGTGLALPACRRCARCRAAPVRQPAVRARRQPPTHVPWPRTHGGWWRRVYGVAWQKHAGRYLSSASAFCLPLTAFPPLPGPPPPPPPPPPSLTGGARRGGAASAAARRVWPLCAAARGGEQRRAGAPACSAALAAAAQCGRPAL